MSVLCRLDELADPGARGFAFGEGGKQVEIFVVRRGGRVFGYENRCPHAFARLDRPFGDFLDPTETFLRCGAHDALFGIEDGLCVAGPCRGARLAKIDVRIVENGLECAAVVWPDAPAGPIAAR